MMHRTRQASVGRLSMQAHVTSAALQVNGSENMAFSFDLVSRFLKTLRLCCTVFKVHPSAMLQDFYV